MLQEKKITCHLKVKKRDIVVKLKKETIRYRWF